LDLKEYLTLYEIENLEKASEVRNISLSLRRGRITTMEELCELQNSGSEKIAHIRDIGPKKLAMIKKICQTYKEN